MHEHGFDPTTETATLTETDIDPGIDGSDAHPARRTWIALTAVGLAIVLVLVALAVVGGEDAREATDASEARRASGATSSTFSTSTTSTSTEAAVASGAGGEASGGSGSGGPGAPSGIGPRLRAPQAPIVLPLGVDTGSFSISNTGDAPLRLLDVDHPGVLSAGHDDPVPDVVAAGATVDLTFALLAPDLNGFTPGPWERVITILSDGGDAEIVVRGTAPTPGDLAAPQAVPPVPYPQGQAFWIEQLGSAPTTVTITVDPGLTLNDDNDFTMGVGAKMFVGVQPCGRPAAAVDKTMMRKVYLHVGGHGTLEVQVFWEIEAGPAVPCASQTL